MNSLISNSEVGFLDTNVLIRHVNGDLHPDCADIGKILDEAANGKRKLFISSVFYAECRPSHFVSPKLDFEYFIRYVRSITELISPLPETMLQAARLRDKKYWRRPPSERQSGEKARQMSLGDAIHLASALFVQQELAPNVEFLTFDDSDGRTSEIVLDYRALPILSLHEYTRGLSQDPDVRALIGLPRRKPLLQQPNLSLG